MEDREFLLGMRRGILVWLDAIERKLGIHPTTSQLRAAYKALKGKDASQ